MAKTTNILLCGVGGQGIILSSEILSSVLMHKGHDVKQSEVHGMAQRGGSVVAHLRFGEKVYSPLIELGAADFAVSFELLEALRYLPYLHRNSILIVNTQKILPAPVSTGLETYPENVLEQLQEKDIAVYPVDAFGAAKSIGESRAVNMVLVGALSRFLSVDEDAFISVIKGRIPEKILKKNMDAFLKGREIIGSMQQQTKTAASA